MFEIVGKRYWFFALSLFVIIDALQTRFGELTELEFDSVGPAVGAQVARAAMSAVALAALGILIYIWFAFRQVPKAFRYGVAAIMAMLHDVFVVLGLESIFGFAFGWQVDSLFVTALLTVIGFSVHDTIVVFDRIRENIVRRRGEPYDMIVNHSITQTLDRSINTQLMVMFPLLVMILFGGVTVRHFVTILLLGVLSGTYSSIFNAAPILVVWEKREWRVWLRRHAPATVQPSRLEHSL